MSWKEEWRHARRPHPSEIPKSYALWPAGTDLPMALYFGVVLLLTYLGLEYVGVQGVLIVGLPPLILLTMMVSLLFVVGLLLLAHRSRKNRDDRSPREISQ